MKDLEKILAGGDLRSLGKNSIVVLNVANQSSFDELFKLIFHTNRIIIMRAADAIEKISAKHPDYLHKHKKEIIGLSKTARNKELIWHLALLIPRLPLTKIEWEDCWGTLTNWSKDKLNSKIVRVNAIQGLSELVKNNKYETEFRTLLLEIKKENIPSINARIRLLNKTVTKSF